MKGWIRKRKNGSIKGVIITTNEFVFVKRIFMRCRSSIKAFVAVMLVSLTSVQANESKVMQAQFELGTALTKLGLLTNSFTEKGMQSPSIAGANAAQDMTSSLDKIIVDGLQHNASCDRIQEVMNSKIANMYDDKEGELGDAAKKAANGVKVALRNYVEVQCANLTE
ncbi:hypothetical protein [Pantoea sp. ACRSB]|uniref:hypothetical protein n=1 Tax=Pantoea sp. ACRSB TaxID=2918207 RepID=UPI002893363F|nr:hypothetical protein [Pantoea sp. ACRSB]MCG7388307.1 hypothetical protein [Pantoea sp. ACRSB]